MRGGGLTVGARGGGSSGWTGGRIIPGPPVSAFYITVFERRARPTAAWRKPA